ncbi:MAG: PDZ domain-containing protein [Pirellulaceae bacterium]|nr:PDZ domain-containing protein [Pirellulaceae bacterium]
MATTPVRAQEREIKVRGDQSRILKEGFWIYNNLPKGFEQAKATGKPLLVVFRCIPCEACAQLDESVIDDNPTVRKWLNQFVPVRIVHTNGMDMHKFQFDYDQSWAAFVLHADGTIIGRYGTRSHQTESDDDVSLEGFLESLGQALEIHRDFAKHRSQLVAKTGPKAPVDRPEEFPKLKEKYGSTLDYEGKVVASCIHCHQVGEALFTWKRSESQPLAPEVIFPYPNPKVLGIVMDPSRARTIKSVMAESAAEQAGLKAGDEIVTCESQPIISTADIQWVLHHLGKQTVVNLEVKRGGATAAHQVKLAEGWRERDDIAWRATSWQVRRMVTGGLKLDPITEAERKSLQLPSDALGLRIKHVGQFAPHDLAKRAGFKVGDVLIKVGAWEDRMTESQLLVALLKHAKPGQSLPVELARGDRRLTLPLPVQP